MTEGQPPRRTIRRRSLHDETVTVVREMIFDGSLPPGARIAEQALCEELGISRTPLREALKVLAAEGFVILMPNQGSVVTQVTLEDVEATFEMMEALESQVGRLAAVRANEDDLRELRDMHARMLDSHREGRRSEYFDINQQIHLKLAECSGNRFLASDYKRYLGKVRRARYMANLSQVRWDESAKEHEQIMSALALRDPQLLGEVLRDHLQRTAEVVIAAIRQEQALAPERVVAEAAF